MKTYGMVLVLAATALVVAGCQKSNSGAAAGPTAGGAGMASDSTNNNTTMATSNPVATSPATTAAPPPPALTDAGRNFVMKAAQGGMFEVEAGKLAESHASNAKVKAFGARMVTDHSAADNQLEAIAQRDQLSVPTSLPPDEQTELDHLKSLHGHAFDREYSNMMVKDHKQDVQDFQEAANSLSETDLRSFAQNTLPTLQSHLSMAEELPAEHGHMQANAASSNPDRSNQ